jgi:hypothetical protein
MFSFQSGTILSNVGFEVLAPAFTLVSCSAYFFDPEDGAICLSETSVDTQRTTRRYISDGSLYSFQYLEICILPFQVSDVEDLIKILKKFKHFLKF